MRFLLNSPFADNDGYGSAGIGLLRMFSRMGADFSAVRQPGSRSQLRFQDQQLINSRPHRGEPTDFGLVVTSPDRFNLCSVMPRIGVTMFESTKMPPQFANLLRRSTGLAGVITPTKHSAHAIHNGGCDVPIEVAPLGVDPADWYPDPAIPKFQQFTFVSAGQLSYRKGTDLLIQAFEQEFKSGEPVGLLLKTTTPWGMDFKATDPRIQIHASEWSVDQLRMLFNQCHCYVGPSRGEGFGLVPLQAMACGLRTVVTNLPAGAPYLGWPEIETVAFDEVENAGDFWWHRQLGLTDCGQWYRPSVPRIREAMRKAYEEGPEACRDRGAKLAQHAVRELSWDVLRNHYLHALEAILQGAPA